MTDKKLYPAVKRVELAELSDGWDAECFAYVVPSNYEDRKKLAATDVAGMTPEEQLDYQLAFTLDHFISGKIKAFNGETFEIIDMEPEHLDASMAVADYIYSEIMGLGLDPKDIRKVALASALRGTDSTPTETSLSTEEHSTSTEQPA